jgi:hypothetical protein
MSNHTTDTFAELRHDHFDGNDPFMTGGHGILRPRILRPSKRKTLAAWATSDEAIQKILLSAFPKHWTNARQMQRAGRWVRIIHLYFRLGMSSGYIAEETGLKRKNVENMIASIRRVARGLRADNRGLRGLRRRGRPNKKCNVEC